jgi:hypothetical protein
MPSFALSSLRSFAHRALSALPLVAALVAGPSLVACSYTQHQGVMANGASSQLYFWGAAPLDATELLATGYGAKVVVQRWGPSDVPCTGLGLHKNAVGAGGVHIQGGDLPDPDHCGSRVADVVSVVSAACTDDTCSVTVDSSDPHAVTLRVTGMHAGEGVLAVSLKSAADGKTYDDSIPVRFSAPARIRLAAYPRDVATMSGPVLPGVALTKPRAYVVDAADARLTIDANDLQATSDGDAYVDAEYSLFKADHAGHTVLHWAYPGVAERSLDLEVVDPKEAHALFVYAPLPDGPPSGTSSRAGDGDPADAAPISEPPTGRITSIELVTNDYGTYPVRVKLADGRFALANVDSPVLAPAALGSVLSALEPSALDVEAGKTAGQGTLTLRAGPDATATLAVKVTARSAK